MIPDKIQPNTVELLSTRLLAEGHLRLEQLTLRIETFAGTLSGVMERQVLRSGSAVVVLLFDPKARQLILIEQFRIGAYLNQLPSQWILECVAGKVDAGETSEDAARREALEETGCTVARVERIGAYLSSPGISDELVTIYVGEIDAASAGGVHGKVAEQEDIRTVCLRVDEAIAAADQGLVVNVMTQVALLWFSRHGEALSRRWARSSPPGN